VDAPTDPYAPPSSRVAPPESALASRYLWAERSLLVVLATLLAMVALQMVLQLRAGAPFRPIAFAALYQLGVPGAALLLVLLGKEVGYLVALMAGSMFLSLSPPVLMASPFWGGLLIALSVAIWGLSWFAARGRFGYLFKRPRHLARPSRAGRGPRSRA
jgi:hypothetical protein